VELRYDNYLDKVYAGWIGKCIGGAIGFMQENNKSVLHYTPDTAFPATIPANDDLDLQVLWLQELLEKKGSHFTERDVGEVFAKYNLLMAGEYSFAIRNIELGIAPPLSGSYNNSFWKHSMGCPIRSEIWGFVCPGDPSAAARYARLDGVIDHVSESIYGEQFYAAIEAMGFAESDLRRLIERALTEFVPAEAKLHRGLRQVLRSYDEGADWLTARTTLLRKFGSSDASDAVTNIGLTVMALLYGEGDYGKTMMLAVNCGYDTDCTAATAGAVLGVIGGMRAIPSWWLDKIGEDFVIGTVDIQRHSTKIVDLAKDTCAAGLSLARDGVIATRFSHVPPDVVPSLPLPREPGPVALDVRYDGLPSIGADETRTVTLSIVNRSDAAVSGSLKLDVAEALRADVSAARLTLEPEGRIELPITFSVRPNIRLLPQRNLVKASFAADGGDLAASLDFGLSGAARVKLIGPFWDDYDTAVFDENPYGEVTQKLNGIADPFAMFNSFVNLDRPYVEESDASFDQAEGEYVNLHEDRIDLRAFAGYEGPCCIYVVHDFVVPEERREAELFVGSNDEYRLWLNGEALLDNRSSRHYMPFNQFRLDVTYRKGANRIVAKLIRKGDRFDFSYLMRSPSLGFKWYVDLAHILQG